MIFRCMAKAPRRQGWSKNTIAGGEGKEASVSWPGHAMTHLNDRDRAIRKSDKYGMDEKPNI